MGNYQATFGTINTPGIVYTGDFSGCVFYLYQTGPGKVTGVHAYRGSQPVTTTTGSFFWKRTQTNQVVREYGPRDYFTRNLGRLICSYPTRGELDVSTGEISMAFLSVVDHTTAVTYLFSVAGTPQGSRVRRLIRTYRADF